jgi:hypothetical protein
MNLRLSYLTACLHAHTNQSWWVEGRKEGRQAGRPLPPFITRLTTAWKMILAPAPQLPKYSANKHWTAKGNTSLWTKPKHHPTSCYYSGYTHVTLKTFSYCQATQLQCRPRPNPDSSHLITHSLIWPPSAAAKSHAGFVVCVCIIAVSS